MITTSICDSFRLEILQGIHQPGDEYRIALYTAEAALDLKTTRYATQGEIIGKGYDAGGRVLTGYRAKLVEFVANPGSNAAILSFDAAVWPIATIKNASGALIYNASKDNRAVAVYKFEEEASSTKSEFVAAFPPATAEEAVISIQ